MCGNIFPHSEGNNVGDDVNNVITESISPNNEVESTKGSPNPETVLNDESKEEGEISDKGESFTPLRPR
eukprot:Pgem_evm1s8229